VDLAAYLAATNDVTRDITIRIEAVHRLSDVGAVITHVGTGTSRQGFVAEWRAVDIMTVDGNQIDGVEFFDEVDIDAALARFDTLNPPSPRLENAASRAVARVWSCLAAGDWAAIAETMADEFTSHDRRRVVNAGVRRGREAHITQMRAVADVGFENFRSTVIATRGERLALSTIRAAVRGESPEEVGAEAIMIVEVDADNRLITNVLFDFDDIDAAFEELDGRYLACEAAACGETWSIITRGYAAANRHELVATPSDFVSVDHRGLALIGSGDFIPYLRSIFDATADISAYVEEVHRLKAWGAVFTHVGKGTTEEGFDAEWRLISLVIVDGYQLRRGEMFDERDLDAALARFDELSRPTPRLENAATRTYDRFNAYLADRDWDAMAEMMTDDACHDDRRRVVSAGVQRGRDAQIANLRAVVDVGDATVDIDVMAIRGERLAVTRTHVSAVDRAAETFGLEMITVIEIDTDNRITAGVLFDVDDINAAFVELETRYVAGEAAAHARTWSAITRAFVAFDNHDLPSTTLNWIDRRRLVGSGSSNLTETTLAAWDMTRDIRNRIEAVHRLDDRRAVVTQFMSGTSRDGFDFEWRVIDVFTIEGEAITRCETFDEGDLDAALARFDELNSPAPQLENAAIRVWTPLADAFNRNDMDGVFALITAEGRMDDRRRGLQAVHEGAERLQAVRTLFETIPKIWLMEIKPVAVRGSRLSLIRQTYCDPDEADRPITIEALTLTEVNDDGLVRDIVLFDPDDINAALEELTVRWITSEEIAHPEVVNAHLRILQELNRHDWDAHNTSMDGATYVNHRQLGTGETVADFTASVTAIASLIPNVWVEPSNILKYSASGAIGDVVAKGTSSDGVEVEIPMILLGFFDGDRLTRFELFDPDQREQALARFDELNQA
jgi:ketosteroid isomerase-like protein